MASEIKLKLAIEGGQVVGAVLDGVGSALDKVENKARGAASGADTLRNMLAAIGTVGTALELIRMADAATTLHTSLRLASNSAAEAGVAYERLFTIAQQARVSFTELGATYTTIARAGNELGVSQERLLTVTQAIGYAMTIGGGSAQSMNAALVQLGQGLSSGTLRGEELNSILEQTPRLAKALADGMGVSVGQLRSLGEQGKLTAETVISALEKSAPQLAKEMASSTVTVGQAFTMLTNSALKFVGEADTASGASSTLAGALQGIAGAVDSVGTTINNHKVAFSAIAAGLAGAAVVTGLAAAATNIGLVTGAVAALGAVMMANPVIAGLALIVAAGAGIASLANDWKNSAQGMRAQMDGINADIGLAEKRAATGSEPVRARAALELQTLKDKRDALRQTMAVQEQSSAENASYNAKEMKGFQEKIAAEQAAYAGAKPLDDVRKMAKLRNDVVQQGYDEAVDLAKGYAKAIANASSPEVALALERERNARLIASAQETTAALKAYDDQKAAPAKEAAKQRLTVLIAGYEQEQLSISSAEQRKLEALSAAHGLGLESDRSYIEARQVILAKGNADQQAVVEQELQAVRKSGLSLKDRVEQENKYNLELKKLREQAIGTVEKADQEIAAADNKVYRAALAQNADYIEAQQAKATSLEEQVKAQRRANAEIGLSAVEVNKLRSATMELAAAEKDRLATQKEKAGLDPDDIKALRDQAKAMRELIVANTDGVQKSAALENFKSIWASVDQTAHGVFTNIFQGGQDAFTKLRDVLKSTLLDLLYQMTVRKWVFEIFANVTGAGASGMTGGIVGNGGSGVMGLVNTASNVNSLYSNGSSLYTVGSQFFGGTMSGANAVGTVGANVTGTGLDGLLASNGAYGTAASTTGTATSAGEMMAAGSSAGPWGMVVAAVIAILASRDATRVASTGDSNTAYDKNGKVVDRFNQLFGGDNPIKIPTVVNGVPVGGAINYSQYNPSDVPAIDGRTQDQIDAANAANNKSTDAHMADISAKTDKYVDSLNAAYLAAAKNLGVGAVDSSFVFGRNDSSGGKFRLAASVGGRSFDSGETALSDAELKLAANRAILTALEGSDLPAYMKGVFDNVDASKLDQAGIDAAIKAAVDLKTAYTALQTIPGVDLTNISFETLNSIKGVAAELVGVNNAFFALGYKLLDISAAGGAAAAGLAAAFGGLQSFQAQMSSYAQNFLSQGEQQDMTYLGVQDELHKAGIDFTVDQLRGANRTDIRAAVDAYAGNVGTTEGQAQYAAVVKAANALASVKPALDKITAAPATVQAGSSSGGGGGGPSAADSVKSALQQYTDAIYGEVKRIRGLMEGDGEEAQARAQMRLDLAAVQADAGSEDALKSLPQLAQNLTLLAESNSSTLLELRMVQAQTAATLERSAAIASKRYGLTVPAFADGGSHGGGWAMVGERGPELAYLPPARIYTASDTRSMLTNNGSGGGAELAAALQAIAIAIEDSKEIAMRAADAAEAVATLFTFAMPDRDALQIRAIT